MSHPTLSVSWDAYQKSICRGLSVLQQRGEFVDMTLAAEGHFVRVHRMVLSLVSPYIKDLLSSADCANPVIFLNQVSYKTLCSILDYVYTGEVHVAREDLKSFIQAAKSLYIRGLTEMEIDHALPTQKSQMIQIHNTASKTRTIIKEDLNDEDDIPLAKRMKKAGGQEISGVFINEHTSADDDDDDHNAINAFDDDLDVGVEQINNKNTNQDQSSQAATMQYSVSNQGNLQMVLNRFLYYLVYTGKTSGHKRWQCIDCHSKRTKCPAAVVTKNGVIVQRISAHNHTYHDAKILKKVRNGTVFSAIQQAENIGKIMHDERSSASGSQDKIEDDSNSK